MGNVRRDAAGFTIQTRRAAVTVAACAVATLSVMSPAERPIVVTEIALPVTDIVHPGGGAQRVFVGGDPSRRVPDAHRNPQTIASAIGGWPQQLLRETLATPVFHDLDGDGAQEVIVGDDYFAYVFDASGNLAPGWPRLVGGVLAQAAVDDIDRDGSLDIVFTTAYQPQSSAPAIWVLDSSGNTRAGWPVALPFKTILNISGPVLADIDGDGNADVGAASELGVFFFDAAGTSLPGWPYLWTVPINNEQWSSPAVGDLDGDGTLEVVVGNAAGPSSGMHVIRSDGTPFSGWPRDVTLVRSSPALADLDGDGDLEIIVQEGDPGYLGNLLHVWHHDGSYLSGWPVTIAAEGRSSRSSPAVADVDGDGSPEIVTATADGLLHVFESDGSEAAGFPLATGGLELISSPAVVDIDGDDSQEIFLTFFRPPGQHVVSGWSMNGTQLPGFPQVLIEQTDYAAHASVHVADADGDGDYELTTTAKRTGGGNVWVLPIDPSMVTPTNGDWPKIRRDAQNRGCFCDHDARNMPPAADAGPDLERECSSPGGTAITLDGGSFSDPDGDPLTFSWSAPGVVFDDPTSSTPTAVFPLGTTEVTLTVSDGEQNATDSILISVRDTSPPISELSVAPPVLWPPNHRLVPIRTTWQVRDLCDGAPYVMLVSVASSEADDAAGNGDGRTTGDIAGADYGIADAEILLRAERSGSGPGRAYELVYRAIDASGNHASMTATVTVPKDSR